MISVVMFSYSETLKSMLVEYAATDMGFLDDYSDADPNHKSIRGNGITKFLFHVAQCNISHLTIFFLNNTYCQFLFEDILFKVGFLGY